MGVMYKLMKHKHSLDMTTVIESNTETLDNKKITAEHILQLCKFLAEKSKRNKQTVKKQNHLECSNVANYELDQDVEEMNTEETKEVEAAALPLIKHNRLNSISSPSPTKTATSTATTKQVLTSKIINTSSTIQHYPPGRSISPTATCSMQYHQQQGSKKDILQKIRSQIMERKRQRQLASMQHISAGGVWRPW